MVKTRFETARETMNDYVYYMSTLAEESAVQEEKETGSLPNWDEACFAMKEEAKDNA
jgi:hypothetical protein